MKGALFEAVSTIQQTATRLMKAIREARFLGHSVRCMSDEKVVPRRAGTILSDN
jgi:hypothetical protein